MNPEELKAVVFDLDGVIFDSRQVNEAFYNHILEYLGRPPMKPEDIEVVHRETAEGSLIHLLGRGELLDQALAYWKQMDPSVFVTQLRLFPHVVECLDILGRNFDLAVATNRTTTTQRALNHFGLLERFKVVVSALSAGVPKPDPRVMDMVLGGLGARRDEVVYVGDSLVDEQFCINSGVRLIGFRDPDLQAWAHVDDLLEIPGLLGIK